MGVEIRGAILSILQAIIVSYFTLDIGSFISDRAVSRTKIVKYNIINL